MLLVSVSLPIEAASNSCLWFCGRMTENLTVLPHCIDHYIMICWCPQLYQEWLVCQLHINSTLSTKHKQLRHLSCLAVFTLLSSCQLYNTCLQGWIVTDRAGIITFLWEWTLWEMCQDRYYLDDKNIHFVTYLGRLKKHMQGNIILAVFTIFF